MNPKRFFAELKRRNVYKVAVAYAVVAWLLMQIATQVFPFLEIPNWAIRLEAAQCLQGSDPLHYDRMAAHPSRIDSVSNFRSAWLGDESIRHNHRCRVRAGIVHCIGFRDDTARDEAH
jgi:hypothetical protein